MMIQNCLVKKEVSKKHFLWPWQTSPYLNSAWKT